MFYRHGAWFVNRVHGDAVEVDRIGVGTQVGKPQKGALLRRQALRRPALALIRPYDLGLVRALPPVGAAGNPIDVVEVLDPEVGPSQYSIRRRDRALVKLRFDLLPLEDTDEEHEYEDFVDVDGIRLPLADRSGVGDGHCSICASAR